MRRLFIIAAILAMQTAPVLWATQQTARTPQERPLQADGIVRLLLDLETALSSGRVEDFKALGTSSLPEVAVSRFQVATRGGPGARAIIRERMRRPNGTDYDVVIDLLLNREAIGRI